MRSMLKTMESNKNAYELMKKAQTTNSLAHVFAGVGGFLIGFPIGQSLGGGDANWALAGIGAGIATIGFTISSKAYKRANQAVELYNDSLDATSSNEFKPEFQVIANKNGVGLSMSF